MTSPEAGRYVVGPALRNPGRWSIFDHRNSPIGQLVLPTGWPEWSVEEKADADRRCQEMNEGGPLVARVRQVLQETVKWDLNDKAVLYTALYFAAVVSQEPETPVEEIVACPAASLAYGAILTTMVGLPSLVDDSAPPPLHAGPPLTELVKQGVAWLATEQPDGAVVSHFGIDFAGPWDGRIRISVMPGPSSVDKWPVVVFDSKNHGHPFTTAEFAALEAATTAAVPVVHHWNGAGCSSVSFAIRADMAPSLHAARARYGRCCPTHQTVFCSQTEGCTWLRDGRALIVRPDGWH